MNKNTIIGSILMAVIVIWWMTTNSANANAKAAAEAKAREAAAAEAAKSETADQLVLPVAEPEVKAAPVLGAPAADKAPADSAVVDSSTAAADSATADSVAAKPVILPRTVTVETDKFIVTLDNKGGKVRSVIVKALADSAGNFPELIQDTTLGALDLTLGKADLSEALFAVDAPEWITVDADTSVQFVFEDVGGNKVIRSYAFTKTGVAVRQVNRFVGFQPNEYKLAWKGGMKETEEFPKGKSFGGTSYFFSEVIFNNGENVEREMVRDTESFKSDKMV